MKMKISKMKTKALKSRPKMTSSIYVVVQVQYDFELIQFILIQCNIFCTGTSCLELVQYKPVCFFQTSLFFSYPSQTNN